MKWIILTGFLVLLGHGEGYAAHVDATPDKTEPDAIAVPIPLSRRLRAIEDKPKVCQSGEEFRLDCNTCLCDNDGLSFSCTRIDCNARSNGNLRAKREASELYEIRTHCKPGSVFQNECSTCTCSEDGYNAMCYGVKCSLHFSVDVNPAEADPGFRCNPGEQFKRDCNDCTCSADGRSTFCTLRLCDEVLTHISP